LCRCRLPPYLGPVPSLLPTLRLLPPSKVGNEEALMNTPDYPDHYRLITGAIWKKDPDMQVGAMVL